MIRIVATEPRMAKVTNFDNSGPGHKNVYLFKRCVNAMLYSDMSRKHIQTSSRRVQRKDYAYKKDL